jgi:hypothetical protein
VTESTEPTNVLFHEQGASWWWVLTGPASAVAMLLIQMSAGLGFQWLVPLVFFVLVSTFVAIQVKAARIHTSVELTPTTLREGTERISIDDIVRVYPAAEGNEEPKWMSARALGELTGVPKGRTGIGVKLTNDRTAQAWARKHQQLRAQLVHLVDERIPPERKS